MNRRGTLFAVSVAALVLTLAPAASAGKGGPGGGGTTGSYSVAVSPAGPYSFGQSVYVTTTVPISMNPFIWMRCYQGGVLVGSSDHAAFPGGWYYNWAFTLGPTMSWTGGAADCTFSVVHTSKSKVSTDAKVSIHVNG